MKGNEHDTALIYEQLADIFWTAEEDPNLDRRIQRVVWAHCDDLSDWESVALVVAETWKTVLRREGQREVAQNMAMWEHSRDLLCRHRAGPTHYTSEELASWEAMLNDWAALIQIEARMLAEVAR